MTHRQIRIFPDAAALADAAARYIVERAQAAVAEHERFTIALSGGSTPRAVFERLAEPSLMAQMPWTKTYVFWSDDRAVPLDHADSNYRIACEALLSHAPLPKDHIKPMLGLGEDLDAAARHYERVIRTIVPGSPPRFDLVLLGMGPDGHTASLFPHSPQLDAADALVVATPVASLKPHVRRVTFTAPLINAAAKVLFMAAGADKAATLQQVLEGPSRPADLPSQLVAPRSGTLVWMLDQAIAQELNQPYE
ncbi:MAG TPA: 6-phosphogluconolactonase [Herpetosiphonaceae bacterium]